MSLLGWNRLTWSLIAKEKHYRIGDSFDLPGMKNELEELEQDGRTRILE